MRRSVAGVLALASALLATGCWPQPNQNADRTNHNPFETTITPESAADLQQQWTWSGSEDIQGPVLSAGGVHVTTACTAVTLHPGTGAERWSAPIVEGPPGCEYFEETWDTYTGEPYVVDTADGPRLLATYGLTIVLPPGYVEEGSWYTRGFDVRTGEADPSIGASSLAGAVRGPVRATFNESGVAPAIAETAIHVGNRSIVLHASVAQDGLAVYPRLTLGTDSVFHAGVGLMTTVPGDPSFGDGLRAFSISSHGGNCGPVIFQFDGRWVECPAWVVSTDGTPTTPVLGSDGTVLYSRTTGGTLYALDAASGAVLWSADGLGSGGAPALVDGRLYVPAAAGRIAVFDAAGCGVATCPPLWEYTTGAGRDLGSLIVGGQVVYVGDGQSLYALDAGECGSAVCDAVLWTASDAGQPVAVGNGQLYTRGGTTLVAYGLG